MRRILRPNEASNDGVRRLRELLRSKSAVTLARALACDPTAVRRWAREERAPGPEMRDAMEKYLGIPMTSWEAPPGLAPDTMRTPPRSSSSRPISSSRSAS